MPVARDCHDCRSGDDRSHPVNPPEETLSPTTSVGGASRRAAPTHRQTTIRSAVVNFRVRSIAKNRGAIAPAFHRPSHATAASCRKRVSVCLSVCVCVRALFVRDQPWRRIAARSRRRPPVRRRAAAASASSRRTRFRFCRTHISAQLLPHTALRPSDRARFRAGRLARTGSLIARA